MRAILHTLALIGAINSAGGVVLAPPSAVDHKKHGLDNKKDQRKSPICESGEARSSHEVIINGRALVDERHYEHVPKRCRSGGGLIDEEDDSIKDGGSPEETPSRSGLPPSTGSTGI